MCGQENVGIACSQREVVTGIAIDKCPTGAEYCMTTIKKDDPPNDPKVYKRYWSFFFKPLSLKNVDNSYMRTYLKSIFGFIN